MAIVDNQEMFDERYWFPERRHRSLEMVFPEHTARVRELIKTAPRK